MKPMPAVLLLLTLLLGIGGSFLSAADNSERERPRLYFRFNGMGALSNSGDFGNFTDLMEVTLLAQNNPPNSVVTVDNQPYFQGFSGEIGLQVSKHMVGVSIGYLKRGLSFTRHRVANDGVISDIDREYTFSAVPIFIFIRYKVLRLSFIDTYFTLGEGVYLGEYRDDYAVTYANSTQTFTEVEIKGRKSSLCFHAGITVDINIARFLAVSIDAGYRLNGFKDIKAESLLRNDSNPDGVLKEDELYYVVNAESNTSRFQLGDSVTEGWEALPAHLHLRGFSLEIGIKLTL